MRAVSLGVSSSSPSPSLVSVGAGAKSMSVDLSGAPSSVLARKELNDVLDASRSAFHANKELSQKGKLASKLDPDGRLAGMVNRLWYRFAFLINAKVLGGGSDLAKETMLLLTVLCEVRQSVVDVFEFSKFLGDKVSVILTRHAWLFDTVKRVEDLVQKATAKVAAAEGKDKSGASE